MEDEPSWPWYNHIGSRDHLHAVGVMIAAWNTVEMSFQGFIQLIFLNSWTEAIRVYALLNNAGRIQLIRNELARKLRDDERELLFHFLDGANICNENRNIVAHANYPTSPDLGPDRTSEVLELSKGRAKDVCDIRSIKFSAKAIREMADATYGVSVLGFQLFSCINLRVSAEAWSERGKPVPMLIPLPQKPPRPRKWDQIQEAP